jgi:hypothetical protein
MLDDMETHSYNRGAVAATTPHRFGVSFDS